MSTHLKFFKFIGIYLVNNMLCYYLFLIILKISLNYSGHHQCDRWSDSGWIRDPNYPITILSFETFTGLNFKLWRLDDFIIKFFSNKK